MPTEKELGKQHPVQSSNLESIGLYLGTPAALQSKVIRVKFQRGAEYDYWPCSEKEFNEAFAPEVVLKDWFSKFKQGKNFKQVV